MAAVSKLSERISAGVAWRQWHSALVVADACLVCIAVVAATVLRYNLVVADVNFVGVALILPWAVGAQLVSGLSLGLYQGRWRFASFDEAAMLAFSALGM